VKDKYEHTSPLFVYEIMSDGYSASVLLTRAMTEEEKADKHKASEVPLVPEGFGPMSPLELILGCEPWSQQFGKTFGLVVVGATVAGDATVVVAEAVDKLEERATVLA
jgi:hypothetical protein